MNYLDRLQQALRPGLHPDWKIISDKDAVDKIREASMEKPQVIFKHSTHCGISSMALHLLESEWNFISSELEFHYLDLIRLRPVSNYVADLFGIYHQSPQIMLLHCGEVVYTTSHHMINVPSLRHALEKVKMG